MKQRISARCSSCKEYNDFAPETNKELTCRHCGKEIGQIENIDTLFDSCPVCGCRQFYLMKDFNQALGCVIMLTGIILVPFTYGLSLPVFALVDWLIYRKVPTLIVCYRCACTFSGFSKEEQRFKPFMHHIGLKYDKDR